MEWEESEKPRSPSSRVQMSRPLFTSARVYFTSAISPPSMEVLSAFDGTLGQYYYRYNSLPIYYYYYYFHYYQLYTVNYLYYYYLNLHKINCIILTLLLCVSFLYFFNMLTL
jgi:hypothetical protein